MHFKWIFLKMANAVLEPLETLLLKTVPDKLVPTVWIIGPPRSGTTLLYQALIERYEFAYLSNFSARFFKAPVIATFSVNRLFNSKDNIIDFTSSYGRTAKWLGPHEAGPFWYRWFPQGDYVYVPPTSISQQQLKYFKKEIVGLSQLAQSPVLFKNVYNSMRIAPIMETFPTACFLVCRRNPLDTAQSILNGRVKLYADKSKWMGVPPQEIDDIRSHPYWEQVAEQVFYIYRQIEQDAQRYGVDHFFDVDYEKFCRNPAQVLQDVEGFFAQHDFTPKIRGEIPTQFPLSTGKQVDDEDYQRIMISTTKLWQ